MDGGFLRIAKASGRAPYSGRPAPQSQAGLGGAGRAGSDLHIRLFRATYWIQGGAMQQAWLGCTAHRPAAASSVFSGSCCEGITAACLSIRMPSRAGAAPTCSINLTYQTRVLTVCDRRCSGSQHGIIRKYGLMMTRRDFREKAEVMGWKKVRAGFLLRFSRACDKSVKASNAWSMPDLYFDPPIVTSG
jgi:ribosomal protein S14